MKKWFAVIVLGFAQFVMVLDSTVMNVSISTIVKDLGTSVNSMQTAITFYTLTMAALMLLGGKLGDVWGRKRALMVGSSVYALGSLITGLSTGFGMLFVGWSIIEGLGAVLVIPAIVALTATNYKGQDRLKAYAILGAVAGAAAAAGPLIGGYVTTYLNWRYVFFAEVVIMIGVLLCMRFITDEKREKTVPKIDISSVLLSSAGLVLMVYSLLQSKTWGLISPRSIPKIGDYDIAPLGISIVAYLILASTTLLYFFYRRQKKLEAAHKNPLVRFSMLSIPQLRSGLFVFLAQYLVIGAVFFVIPIYLQMTLGLNALGTGMKILPLSIALILGSVYGASIASRKTPKSVVRTGQILLAIGVLGLLASINIELRGFLFGLGMFVVGFGLGLLASQLGNINMSAVSVRDGSEVGGLQGVFQNLGSSIGTAIIGSVLVGALTVSFLGNIQNANLPNDIKQYIQKNSSVGISIVSIKQVEGYSLSKGVSQTDAQTLGDTYAKSQIESLRTSLFILFVISLLMIPLSRNIPKVISSHH